MVFKRALLFLAIILMLTGCFRQADEPLDTVNSQNAPDNQLATETQVVTIIDPNATEETPATEESQQIEQVQATATIIIINPNVTEVEPVETTETTIIEPATQVPLTIPTATESGFITPAVEIEVEVPTATPSEAPDQPTLEPTPTAFGAEITASECQHVVQSGENLFRIALNNDVSLDALLRENGLSQASIIQPGQVLTLPGCTAEGVTGEEEIAVASATPLSDCDYEVVAGDTLFNIAIRHDVTLDALLLENNLTENTIIQPGQILRIPGCIDDESALVPSAEETETLTTDTVDQTTIIHTVAAGETLRTIALQYGVTVNDIILANTIPDPNNLSIGQQLVIPKPETGQ